MGCVRLYSNNILLFDVIFLGIGGDMIDDVDIFFLFRLFKRVILYRFGLFMLMLLFSILCFNVFYVFWGLFLLCYLYGVGVVNIMLVIGYERDGKEKKFILVVLLVEEIIVFFSL